MRLIDADALIRTICGDKCGCERNECGHDVLPCENVLFIENAPTISGWISVKDRLPEEHESMFYKLLSSWKRTNSMWERESEKVLVYVSFPDGTGVVTTGCLHDSDWVTTVSKALPQTVTHWMPLPEPPEEVKQE